MSRMPPVPPASRSPKGPGANPKVKPGDQKSQPRESRAEPSRHGNIKPSNQGRQKGGG